MARYLLALKAAGVVVSWGQKAFDPSGEEGSKVSKAEAVDLIRQLLKLLDVNAEDLLA